MPFWFITIHLSAGWLFGYTLMRWAKRSPNKLGRFVVQIGESKFSFAHESTGGDAPVPVPVEARHAATDDTFVASSYVDEDEPVEDDATRWHATQCARHGHHPHSRTVDDRPGTHSTRRLGAVAQHDGQPGLGMGAVELLGLPGQARVARVQRPHDRRWPTSARSTAAVARCGSTTPTRIASARPRR